MTARSLCWGGVALCGLLLGCTTVLGIDGDYDDGFDGGAGVGGAAASAGVGGSGGAAAGGGSGGGGGTAAVAGNETCDNGTDDDGDGKADCADPDCAGAGFQCLPLAPADWLGPMRWESAAGAPPACDGAWGVEYAAGGSDLSIPAGGTCPTCSCGTPTGVQCGLDVTLYNQLNCTGSTKVEPMKATGGCVNVSDPFSPKSARATGGFKVVAGNCSASSSGTASFPPATFQMQARVCRAASGGAGCGGSDYCVPPSGSAPVCIARLGDHACPAPYTAKQSMFQGVDDKRACTACGCGAPTSQCTGAQITHHDSQITGCVAPSTTFSSTCSNIDIHPTFGSYKRGSIAPALLDASCAPTGGTVQGSASPTDPVTVCCLP